MTPDEAARWLRDRADALEAEARDAPTPDPWIYVRRGHAAAISRELHACADHIDTKEEPPK